MKILNLNKPSAVPSRHDFKLDLHTIRFWCKFTSKLSWHQKIGESQADRYYNTLFEYFEIIAERPFSFPAMDFIKKGYRRCVCGVDSIYYRINDKGIVEIMTIVGIQDLENIFE